MQSHSEFNGNRINAFICDVANEELCDKVLPSSIDVITLVSEIPVLYGLLFQMLGMALMTRSKCRSLYGSS